MSALEPSGPPEVWPIEILTPALESLLPRRAHHVVVVALFLPLARVAYRVITCYEDRPSRRLTLGRIRETSLVALLDQVEMCLDEGTNFLVVGHSEEVTSMTMLSVEDPDVSLLDDAEFLSEIHPDMSDDDI